MIHVQRWQPAAVGAAVLSMMGLSMTGLSMIGLAACGSALGSKAAAAKPPPPRLVTARPAGGAAGRGPLVIATPTPLPTGKAGSQEVVLGDRILVISNVSRQQGTDKKTAHIELNLAVRNTGIKPIDNKPAFFDLISGGDIFSYQENSSNGFYGSIGAHATRTGMIEFQVPAAAASPLYLLYRTGTSSQVVLTRLTGT